jgi:hypothetical protein
MEIEEDFLSSGEPASGRIMKKKKDREIPVKKIDLRGCYDKLLLKTP